MIDPVHDELIPLYDVPKLLGPRPRSGKLLHISAVYRWAQRGVNGAKLEVIRIGKTTYTSAQALRRFVERQNLPRGASDPPEATPAQRRKRAERARREVERILSSRRGSGRSSGSHE